MKAIQAERSQGFMLIVLQRVWPDCWATRQEEQVLVKKGQRFLYIGRIYKVEQVIKKGYPQRYFLEFLRIFWKFLE